MPRKREPGECDHIADHIVMPGLNGVDWTRCGFCGTLTEWEGSRIVRVIETELYKRHKRRAAANHKWYLRTHGKGPELKLVEKEKGG